MDNRYVKVLSESKEDLKSALSILFHNAAGGKATHIKIENDKRMILYWHSPNQSDVTRLPYPMNLDQTLEMIWEWLQQTAIYDNEPEHDGDNKRGFLIYCEGWGRINNDFYSFVGIEPAWAMYGK